jgi:hypothetical protein
MRASARYASATSGVKINMAWGTLDSDQTVEMLVTGQIDDLVSVRQDAGYDQFVTPSVLTICVQSLV